jgi:hypothetical protein
MSTTTEVLRKETDMDRYEILADEDGHVRGYD